MTRVKRSVHARKKRRATLAMAKGYRGDASRHYRVAKEAVLKADQYRYRDRRNRKRDFRRLWITRINAAARQQGMSYSQFMHGLQQAGVEGASKVLPIAFVAIFGTVVLYGLTAAPVARLLGVAGEAGTLVLVVGNVNDGTSLTGVTLMTNDCVPLESMPPKAVPPLSCSLTVMFTLPLTLSAVL